VSTNSVILSSSQASIIKKVWLSMVIETRIISYYYFTDIILLTELLIQLGFFKAFYQN